MPIVPLLMGARRRGTIEALAAALVDALLAAARCSSPAPICRTTSTRRLPRRSTGRYRIAVSTFDTEALLERFESYPEHDRGRSVGCGIGPAIAVMMAAHGLGAGDARVLRYGHSGEISGDYGGVVGYLAAAFGNYG